MNNIKLRRRFPQEGVKAARLARAMAVCNVVAS